MKGFDYTLARGGDSWRYTVHTVRAAWCSPRAGHVITRSARRELMTVCAATLLAANSVGRGQNFGNNERERFGCEFSSFRSALAVNFCVCRCPFDIQPFPRLLALLNVGIQIHGSRGPPPPPCPSLVRYAVHLISLRGWDLFRSSGTKFPGIINFYHYYGGP